MTGPVNDGATVNSTIKSAQEALQKHLDTLPKHLEASRSKTIKVRRLIWPLPYDPVRTKNLQKINGFLLKMLRFNLPLSASDAKVQPLISILNLIKCPETLSSDSVWEQADLLEIELVELGDDNYIYLLLKEQQKSYSEWERYFLRSDLDDLLEKCSNGTFRDWHERLKAKKFLVHLLQARMNEYRLIVLKLGFVEITLVVWPVSWLYAYQALRFSTSLQAQVLHLNFSLCSLRERLEAYSAGLSS